MEDYYEYLDSNGVTTLYKLIKDDTVALIDSYSVTINGITTTLDTHINDTDIHTPISDIENMVDTKISGLVNSAPETLDTLKELSDALGNDSNFATTVVNQIGNKADKDTVYTKLETDTLLEGKANSVHNHVVNDITDFPTIPTKTSELINDSGFLTSSSGVITSVSWSDITDKPNFSTVATSGSYTDLSNTPTIPTKVSQLENDMGFGTGGGSGDTSDCVHKTGNETIEGIKTFSNGPWVTNNQTTMGYSIKNTALARNEVPTQIYYATFRAYDKNDKILGEYGVEKSTTGCTLLNMNVRSEDSNGKQLSETLYLNMSNDDSVVSFYPNSNNKMNLGLRNHKWAKIYSDDVVHTSGDETIAGNKTFSNQMYLGGGGTSYGIISAKDNNSTLRLFGGSSVVAGANLDLYGEGLESGKFSLRARTRDKVVGLDGKTDGTLKWGDKNVALDENLVHRTGDEYISGIKSFRGQICLLDNIINKNNQVDLTVTPTTNLYTHYMFIDKNSKVLGFVEHAQRNAGVSEVGLWVKDKNSNTYGVRINTNKEFLPSTNNAYSLGSSSVKWKNVYATTFNGNLSGTIASSTTATTQATSDNSTRIATTAWVRNYVNSVRSNAMGSNAVNSVAGSNAAGSSIAAYYSNATTLTAEGSSSSSGSSYPSDYSDYIDISPTEGTIYTGSQLFSTLNASASGSKNPSNSDSGTTNYQTTAKATATFSGAFSSSSKYLCTTANAVRFRAFVSQGTTSDIGTASVVDNSSARSIFIRIE